MRKTNFLLSGVVAALLVSVPAGFANAEDLATYTVTLKGQEFTPAEITAKAGEAFRIKLINENSTPAELESSEMGFEKIAAGSSEIIVNVRPQKPGKYKFVDEFHEDEAFGYIIVE